MMIRYPKYFTQFSCIAAACPDSCCKEWEVAIDEASAAYYQSLPGQLGDRLRQVIRQEDGLHLMTIENGRCPMWRQDGLCAIQAQYGHEALCRTCRDFPRLQHEYEGFTERDLELSCPEAAKLIFFGDASDITEGTAEPTQDALLDILLRSRQTALGFLENAPYSLPQKLTVLLLYTHSVQAWIDGGEEPQLDPNKALRDAQAFAGDGDITPMIEYYVNLEILTDRWIQRLNAPAPHKQWDKKLVQFMTYGIRRYWLQAVSDYDLLCRVKFLISACLLLHHLGGDTAETAQLWSKEIENNQDNVEALWDAAYTHPAFTDLNLLHLLA